VTKGIFPTAILVLPILMFCEGPEGAKLHQRTNQAFRSVRRQLFFLDRAFRLSPIIAAVLHEY
jgi:hypothetical protein